VIENNITHNTCTNFDQEWPGPWCYTTDPLHRWEYCGICDAKFNQHVEYEPGNSSWIEVVKEQFLNKYPEKEDKIPELQEDLRILEATRNGFVAQSTYTAQNYANDEMARRIIDLTSPGGFVRNSDVEMFTPYTTVYNGKEHAMNDTVASTFLKLNGWHFDKRTFPLASINGEKIINLQDFHEIELTKYLVNAMF